MICNYHTRFCFLIYELFFLLFSREREFEKVVDFYFVLDVSAPCFAKIKNEVYYLF